MNVKAKQAGQVVSLLLLLLLLCAPQAAAEGPETLLRISPAQVEVGEGLTAAVQVRVEGVQALYALDIRLSFDPAVLQVVDADPAAAGTQVRPGDLLKLDLVARNTADNVAGSIWFAITQANPSPEVSGSAVAFTVTFRGRVGGGRSPLAVTYAKLATRDGRAIPLQSQPGEIAVVAALQAPPTPTPAPPPPQPALEQTALAPTPESDPIPPSVPRTKGGNSRGSAGTVGGSLPALAAAAAGGLLALTIDSWRRRRGRPPA